MIPISKERFNILMHEHAYVSEDLSSLERDNGEDIHDLTEGINQA